MQNKPSFYCHDVKPKGAIDSSIQKDQSSHPISAAASYNARRERRKSQSHSSSNLRKDRVKIHDIINISDWTSWFENYISPDMTLHVKGPTAYLYFSFCADNTTGARRVIPTARRFASPKDEMVPVIFPNYSSSYYQQCGYRRSSTSPFDVSPEFDASSFPNEMRAATESSAAQNSGGEIMGLRPFKVQNVEETIFNIISEEFYTTSTTSEDDGLASTLQWADFDDSLKAIIPYLYAKSIIEDKQRTLTQKEEVKLFLTSLPPRPASVFKTGDSAKWVESQGIRNNVLERVMEKLKKVKRPDANDYHSFKNLDASDEEIMAELGEEAFFTEVANPKNAGTSKLILLNILIN